jgi:hypothetical protein
VQIFIAENHLLPPSTCLSGGRLSWAPSPTYQPISERALTISKEIVASFFCSIQHAHQGIARVLFRSVADHTQELAMIALL